MALKADRILQATEVGFYLPNTASKGSIVSLAGAGSGNQMDSSSSTVKVKADSSGAYPIGVLLDDVVNIDLTRQPVNWHQSQCASGDKVSIMTKGWVVTDQVVGTPTAGKIAVLASSGKVMNQTDVNIAAADANENPVVGKFLSGKDEDGYVRLYVDL